MVLYIPGGCLGFLNHQQYHKRCWTTCLPDLNIFPKPAVFLLSVVLVLKKMLFYPIFNSGHVPLFTSIIPVQSTTGQAQREGNYVVLQALPCIRHHWGTEKKVGRKCDVKGRYSLNMWTAKGWVHEKHLASHAYIFTQKHLSSVLPCFVLPRIPVININIVTNPEVPPDISLVFMAFW